MGCESEADLVAIASRLSDGEANVTITDGMVVVVDGARQWHLVMATAILALLPPVIVVVGMQRLFVKGLVETEK